MAGNVWNPNAPNTLGFEWFADLFGYATLGAFSQRIRSRSAETINRLDAFISSSVADQAGLLAEIIPAGSETPSGTVTSVTYQPDADIATTGWFNQALSTTNMYQSIDEGVSTVNTGDWVSPVLNTIGNYKFHVASNGFPGTARVLDVKIRVSAGMLSAGQHGTLYVGVWDVASSAFRGPFTTQLTLSDTPTVYEIDCGEINPHSLLPWTPTDIRGFDTATNTFGIFFNNSGVNGMAVYAAELVVTYQTTENRVAAATYVKPAGVSPLLWHAYQFQQFCSLPAGGASWSKPNSGDFAIVFRPPRLYFGPYPVSPSQFSMPWSQSFTAPSFKDCPVPGVVSCVPSLDAYGQVVVADYTPQSIRGRTIPVILSSAGPTVSQDSLPYLETFVGFTFNPVPFPDINSGQSVRQYFTPGSSTLYTLVKVLLNPGAATQVVSVKVRRASDDVQFGSTVTIDPNDVRAQAEDGTGLRRVNRNMASGASLVNGTQYYLEFTTLDSTPTLTGWQTCALGNDTITAGISSFGGTTDYARMGPTSYTNYDIPFALVVPPAAPSGLAASASNKTNNVVAGVQNCVPSAIQAITVTWNTTGLGIFFDHYELRRKRAGADDSTYVVIAQIGTESSTSFIDYETARNVAYQYEVAVVRTDGAESLWSAPTAGVTAVSKSCEVIFTSNENPSLNCAFEYEPGTDFNFVSAGRDEIVPIYGSDYQVAFMECENSGTAFTRSVIVNGLGISPAVADESIFQPLRNISRAALSYVCVMDYVGNQWLAHLQVGVGHWVEPGHQYLADVTITEVSNVPSTVVGV